MARADSIWDVTTEKAGIWVFSGLEVKICCLWLLDSSCVIKHKRVFQLADFYDALRLNRIVSPNLFTVSFLLIYCDCLPLDLSIFLLLFYLGLSSIIIIKILPRFSCYCKWIILFARVKYSFYINTMFQANFIFWKLLKSSRHFAYFIFSRRQI